MRRMVNLSVVLLVVLAGCTDAPVRHAAIDIVPSSALADSPVSIHVSGLPDRKRITVTMRASQPDGKSWSSHADFAADGSGVVDLGPAVPSAGTYEGADPMGLVWSMGEDGADPDLGLYVPPLPELQPYYDIHMTVSADGREVAQTDIRRTLLASGATAQAYAGPLVGELYKPPTDAQHPTGVLVFGGSEGGNSQKYTAAMLASHGYPALALAYFAAPGLPDALRDIPIEYFAGAIDRLRQDAHVDKVVLVGYSRGTEAALLTSAAYAEKVAGLVLYAPSDQVYGSWPVGGAAWTLHGQEQTAGPIAVAGIRVPVLAVAGGRDGLWPSAAMAMSLGGHIRSALAPRLYPEAGHLVGTLPYLPTGTKFLRGSTAVGYGGTREADERAREDSWPRVLELLATTA